MTEADRVEVLAETQDDLAALALRTQDELDEMEAQPKYGIAFFLLGSMTTLFGLVLVLMCVVAAVLGLAFAEGAMVGALATILAIAAVQGALGLGMFRYPDHFLWIMVGVAAVSVALAELRKRRKKKRWDEDAAALEPPADDPGDHVSEDGG